MRSPPLGTDLSDSGSAWVLRDNPGTMVALPLRSAALWAFLLSLSALAPAQETGAPVPADAPEPPPPAWTGAGQVSFLRTSGNTETSVLGLASELHYNGTSPWSAAAKAAVNRGSVSGEENLRNLAASLRGGRALNERTDFFLEVAYTEDIYAGIDSRLETQLGVAHVLVNAAPHSLSIEGGVGYAHEVRLPLRLAEDFAFDRARLTYKYTISKTAEVQNEASYFGNLKDASDWRFNNVAALTAALNSRFSLKLSHAVSHFNTPPDGKKKTDTVMAAALVAKF